MQPVLAIRLRPGVGSRGAVERQVYVFRRVAAPVRHASGRLGLGNAEHFLGGGDAVADLVPAVLAEQAQAVAAGGLLDDAGRRPLDRQR
jgi:hypothetical protein